MDIPLWVLITCSAMVIGSAVLYVITKCDLKRIEAKYGGNDDEGYETNPN